MKVDAAVLAPLCHKYGALLHVPDGIDGAQLLWALAGNESSFGCSSNPRHEPGYCRGGRYFDKAATDAWGCLAHCSLGPWQLMLANAPGYSPLELLTDPDRAGEAVMAFLNREIFGRQQAQTLEQAGDAYNSGNFRDANIPEAYILRLERNYKVLLP